MKKTTMAICRSAKIENVVTQTGAALDQVVKLENGIKSEENKRNQEFMKRIDDYLNLSGVNDEKFIQQNTYVKVEYASEFSLDKIVDVVKTALRAAAVSTIATSPAILLSSNAAESYSEVIVAIGEAAKSSSSTAANGSFSATRLAPGIIAFIYSTSVNIKEIQTFGAEAITATAMQYALIESHQDFVQKKNIETIQCTINSALKGYKDFITLQASLVDRLSRGEITLDQYIDLDDKYSVKAQGLKRKVQDAINDVDKRDVVSSSYNLDWKNTNNSVSVLRARSSANKNIVESSLKTLSEFGEKYNSVIALNQKRISANFY